MNSTLYSSISRVFGVSTYSRLALIHLLLALYCMGAMLLQLAMQNKIQYLLLAGLAFQFFCCQLFGLKLAEQQKVRATWVIILSLSGGCILLPLLIDSGLLVAAPVLATIPLFIVATNQLRQMPMVLFVTFVVAALTLFFDLITPWQHLQLEVPFWNYLLWAALAIFIYILLLGYVYSTRRNQDFSLKEIRINLATQYALVISGISALVIILVTSVLITQIRNTQVKQVGQSFQTIAENFAKLAGSHLEQQMQKLQLISEQVPTLRQSLKEANSRYAGKSEARRILAEKNTLWQGPGEDKDFVMGYLNNPAIEALSRFRGHNSFHNDILLVDGSGGLVAALGKKPDSFYFYDQHWWLVSWNGGLGNIFIGDHQIDSRTHLPKVRISVDIVDHTTNKFIGVLSSIYLLRTLIEDMQRFKPDSVEEISIIDATGRIIISTDQEERGPWLDQNLLQKEVQEAKSGWILAQDYHEHEAFIGYSALSTAYSVISDPLHRLGWQVIVNGSEEQALAGVIQTTKLVVLIGLAAMGLGVLGAIAAARVITRPIEHLTETASAMSAGNLNHRADETGPEELVALSVGFNSLTGELNRVIKDLKLQTLQLAKAKSEAETATQLKGEFLANMSHEIRTPLNAILGFAGILESSLKDGKNKRHAHTIKTSGSVLLHLINDILDLSKIEAGRMEMKKTAVDIRSMFQELEQVFSIIAEEKEIEVEMKVEEKMVFELLLDEKRLKQVLFNLIGNGVKFTEKGGVYCYASVEENWQDPNCLNLCISVRDTGIGLDPENYAKIFETFRQHNPNPSGSMEGTGLGLTISKNLVEMMGGTISVEGEVGVGTTFTVYIPHVEKQDRSGEDLGSFTKERERLLFEPASILIVDDLEVNRKLLTEMLEGSQLDLVEAMSGFEALQFLDDNRFDGVLMDIRMPDLDGYETLARMRKHENGRDIPIIALTASGMIEEIDKIQQSGFTDYLIRPFTQGMLHGLMADHFLHSKAREVERSEQIESERSLLSAYPSSWLCSIEVEELLVGELKSQWRLVKEKQSMPEIIEFAGKIEKIGQRYDIDILCRYGEELKDFADSFDIENVEKLLNLYEDLLSKRVFSVS